MQADFAIRRTDVARNLFIALAAIVVLLVAASGGYALRALTFTTPAHAGGAAILVSGGASGYNDQANDPLCFRESGPRC